MNNLDLEVFEYTYTDLFEYTYTDLFGGEPNFCWVRRVMARNIRHAKKLLNLTGIRFTPRGNGRWDCGNTTILTNED